jgi:hypothetical protein
MRSLHDQLLSSLLPFISTVLTDQTTRDIFVGQCGLLAPWRHTLSFGKWLGLSNLYSFSDLVGISETNLKEPTMPIFGQRLASQIMSAKSSLGHNDLHDDIGVTVLAILLQELYYCPHHDLHFHLDVTQAVYIAFYQFLGSNGKNFSAFPLESI